MIRRTPRPGFTLIEVLVAAGLCMLIMYVVTAAFQKGMDTLSQLKSVGELQQRLRNFERVVRDDMEAEHFDSRYGPKLSDQKPNLLAGVTDQANAQWRPPTQGFFRIVNDCTTGEFVSDPEASTVAVLEGNDTDGIPSTRATTHMLHFTVKRDGSRGDKLFTAQTPTGVSATMQTMSLSQMSPTLNTMATDWAEVVYFLDIQHTVGRTPGQVPLYGLYRRTRLVAGAGQPSTANMTPMLGAVAATEVDRMQNMSMVPYGTNAQRPMNGPAEVRNPRNRLGGMRSERKATKTGGDAFAMNCDADVIAHMAAMDTSGNWTNTTQPVTKGDDLLLTDVISFEIKADWDVPTAGSNIPATPANSIPSSYEFPFNILPPVAQARNGILGASGAQRRIFDTWYDPTDMFPVPVTDPVTPPDIASLNRWLPDTSDARFSGAGNGTSYSAWGSFERLPNPIRIRALQIKVRVWDRKNNMARQVTIIQDV